MLSEDKAFKLIEIFITCDHFCKALTDWQRANQSLPRIRAGELSDSEMLSIVIFYHHSPAKCFEYYYRNCVQMQLYTYFPTLISLSYPNQLPTVCGAYATLVARFVCAA